MKKLIISLFSVAACMLNAATVDIRTTEFRNYKVGETVTFTVTAKADDGSLMKDGVFTVYVRDSGIDTAEICKPIEIDLSKANPAKFTAKLDRPGFIFASPSSYKTADGKYNRWKSSALKPCDGGAAVEPEKIRQGGTMPSDFDEFWQKSLAEYKNAKITVKEDPEIKRPGCKVSRVRVEFPDGSGFIDGFLSIPEGAGKFPAIVSVPGAGHGTTSPYVLVRSSQKCIELHMNVHPYPTMKTSPEMSKLYKDMNSKLTTKAYQHEFAWDRDKYVYRKVWSALSRAIDYVAQLPQFDGKHFAASGNSQGGGTALAMGYLNKNITCVAASVPALCDHGGYLAKRQSGWPRLHKSLKGRADKTAPYFDGANFTAKIKVPTIITVGYIDRTCSPSSVYAAYNNLKSPVKQIFPMYLNGHRSSPQGFRALTKFLNWHFSQ